MSGVISGFGGPVGTTLFTEDVAEPPGSRLVAVVIWRRVPAPADRPRSRQTAWAPPDGWSGARSGDGGREVLYNGERRVVRVLGREYPLPSDGAALLLLIEESRDGETPPAVTVRALPAPVHPRSEIDRTLDKPARLALMSAASRAEHETWARVVRSDPAVRAFLAADAGEGAT